MDADTYQQLAARTLIDGPDFEISPNDLMIIWCAFGLAGETGEIVDHVKKGVFHQRGIDMDKIKRELGDAAWYMAGLCTKLGLSLSDVFETNDRKLKARYPDGWDHTRSGVREGEAR